MDDTRYIIADADIHMQQKVRVMDVNGNSRQAAFVIPADATLKVERRPHTGLYVTVYPNDEKAIDKIARNDVAAKNGGSIGAYESNFFVTDCDTIQELFGEDAKNFSDVPSYGVPAVMDDFFSRYNESYNKYKQAEITPETREAKVAGERGATLRQLNLRGKAIDEQIEIISDTIQELLGEDAKSFSDVPSCGVPAVMDDFFSRYSESYDKYKQELNITKEEKEMDSTAIKAEGLTPADEPVMPSEAETSLAECMIDEEEANIDMPDWDTAIPKEQLEQQEAAAKTPVQEAELHKEPVSDTPTFAKGNTLDETRQRKEAENLTMGIVARALNRESEKNLDSLEPEITPETREAKVAGERGATLRQLNLQGKAIDEQAEIIKETLEKDKEKLRKLEDKAVREAVLAELNGYNKSNGIKAAIGATLNSTLNQIANEQKELAKSIRDNKQKIQKLSEMKEAVNHQKINLVKDYIKSPFRAARERIIESGKNALTRIAEKVKSANAKFRTMGDTAYTKLAERTERQARGHLAYAFSVDKSIAQGLEEKKQLLVERYIKKETISQAKQNLWRARHGLKLNMADIHLTKKQAEKIAEIDAQIKGYKDEMREFKREYDLSRQRSLANIRSAQELREANGMKESKSLQKAYQDAGKDIYEVIEGKEEDNVEKAPEMSEHTEMQPEREDRIMRDSKLSANEQDANYAGMDIDEAFAKIDERRKTETTTKETTKETSKETKDGKETTQKTTNTEKTTISDEAR